MKTLFYVFLGVVIAAGVWLVIQYMNSDPDCVKSPATGECAEGYGY
jgi:hypothetical protein